MARKKQPEADSAETPFSDQEGGVATLDRPEAHPAAIPGACIGLNVQYHTMHETLPGILQRQSLADPSLWELKVFLSGVASPVLRIQVKFSATPKANCWSFLPKQA